MKTILARVLVALLGLAMIGGALWLVVRPRTTTSSAPPPAPATGGRTASLEPDPGPSSSPWPVRTGPGFSVSVAPGATTTDLDASVRTGLRWVVARYSITTTRPYPGIDTTTLEQLTAPSAADALAYELRDWRNPRAADRDGYAAQARVHFRREPTVTTAYVADHTDGRRITYEYDLSSLADDRQPVVEHRRVQLTLAMRDNRWKISEVDEHPQGL